MGTDALVACTSCVFFNVAISFRDVVFGAGGPTVA
jgi:hypothetical protein